MLFVHYYKAQVFERRKYAASCADNNFRFAPRERPPGVEPLAVGEPAVPYHEPAVSEAAFQPPDSLGGERYFRHEKNARSAVVEHFLHCPHIDFRLARARHSVEQAGFEGMGVYVGRYFVEGFLLLGVERRRGGGYCLGVGQIVVKRSAPDFLFALDEKPFFYEGVYNRRICLGEFY